jgi:formate/nitrite transporter FocA (FNT family)
MMDKRQAKVDLPLGKGTISTREEEKQVEDRQAIGANVVYETIRREGEEELHRPAAALAWSAFAAGLSMGFSFVAQGVLMGHLPDQPWRPLIAGTGYCVGFLIVILGRQQLFTENTLTVVLPLLLRKDLSTLLRMLRLWVVVLGANLVGTFLFALSVGRIGIFDARTQQCLAESARVSIIIIVTYLVGISGFDHIIAGSTATFFLLVRGSISWQIYVVQFFLPTLMGNVIGGLSLVAALGHAQVVGGKGE